jgi:uncharacterized repeat protein (TIGR03803 family)
MKTGGESAILRGFGCLVFWLLAAPLQAQAPLTNFTRLHSFGNPDQMGYGPTAALIEGSDGALYGTTSDDRGGNGSVFRVNKDGSGFAVLHSFKFRGGYSASITAGYLFVRFDEERSGTHRTDNYGQFNPPLPTSPALPSRSDSVAECGRPRPQQGGRGEGG